MKITSIDRTKPTYKHIAFTSTNSNEAALLVHNVPQFKRNLQKTVYADAVQSNPVKALAYKLSKMMGYFVQPRFEEKAFVLNA